MLLSYKQGHDPRRHDTILSQGLRADTLEGSCHQGFAVLRCRLKELVEAYVDAHFRAQANQRVLLRL